MILHSNIHNIKKSILTPLITRNNSKILGFSISCEIETSGKIGGVFVIFSNVLLISKWYSKPVVFSIVDVVVVRDARCAVERCYLYCCQHQNEVQVAVM